MKRLYLLILPLSCMVSAMQEPNIKPTNEEYELFKLVKRIKEIAHESYEEIRRTTGLYDGTRMSYQAPIKNNEVIQGWPLTEVIQGMALVFDDFPISIITPWGTVPILDKQPGQVIDLCNHWAASQLFFTQVKATFYRCQYTDSRTKLHEIKESILFDRPNPFKSLKLIPPSSLGEYVGKPVLITSDIQGANITYSVTHVDSKTVPSLKMRMDVDERPLRNARNSAQLWQLMETRYLEEKEKHE